jgi:predicted nucleic acid-binding protein
LLVYCIAVNTLLHYSTVLVCRGSFYWPPLYWCEETMNEEEEKIRKKMRRTNTEEKNTNKMG